MKILLLNCIRFYFFLKRRKCLKDENIDYNEIIQVVGYMFEIFSFSKQFSVVVRSLLLFIKFSFVVGGIAYNDKQFFCYKGGRKFIKLNNKIVIEFFWFFIVVVYILM